MTPLALIAKESGFTVTGSDIADNFITDEVLQSAGITPLVGFSEEHIIQPDLVITTGAHGGFFNKEVLAAKAKNIPVISAGEALGLFMDGEFLKRTFTGISVAGTHGKTTTSAMLATVLKTTGLDPTYVIGTSSIPSLGASGHLGKGHYFVAEADEYATDPINDKKARFLWQHPKIAIVTNIEFDHPDIYSSIDEVRETFGQFIKQLPEDGLLIAWGDDPQIKKLLQEYNFEKRVITYGFHRDNNYVLKRVSISGEQTFLWVEANGMHLGEFALRVTGEHNALNALSIIVACLEMNVPVEKIKIGLRAFLGSKRRLEFIGNLLTGAEVYDDYAHHPTEIKNTLHALRQRYPKKKIVAVFQPHTYSRTKLLFEEFLRVFAEADEIVLTEIYASLRESPDPTVSSQALAQALLHHHRQVKYLKSLTDVVEYINQKKFDKETVLVTLGAGDVYKIHAELRIN